MATIKDVAKAAGVSYTTVSHVINKTRPVNSETAARVEKAIKELRYRPNRIARNLRKQETRTLGIINSVTNDPYFNEVVAGLERECNIRGYSAIVAHSDMSPVKEKENIEMLLEKGIDGLIVHSLLNSSLTQRLTQDEPFPVIFFQHYTPGTGMDAFCTRDDEGTRLAMNHLMDLGHTKIACIAGHTREEDAHHQRKIAWRDCLLERGYEAPDSMIVEANYNMKSGYESFKALMSLPSPPTAVFCYCDTLAVGAMRAAADLNLSVPEEMSIVGYDNIKITDFLVPRLTTVHQPKFELGVQLFQRIQERIENHDIPPKLHILEPELVVRESTGKPKQQN